MKTLTGFVCQVQRASLWAGLPFCTVVLLVDGYSMFLMAFGSVALELQQFAVPREVQVVVCQLPLSVSDEKQYGLFDGLFQIEAVVE
jgi:hypothetical protein